MLISTTLSVTVKSIKIKNVSFHKTFRRTMVKQYCGRINDCMERAEISGFGDDVADEDYAKDEG